MQQLEVPARTLPVSEPTPQGRTPPAISPSSQFQFSQEPRLEKLTEADDIEHFATACKWPKCDWVFRLI